MKREKHVYKALRQMPDVTEAQGVVARMMKNKRKRKTTIHQLWKDAVIFLVTGVKFFLQVSNF